MAELVNFRKAIREEAIALNLQGDEVYKYVQEQLERRDRELERERRDRELEIEEKRRQDDLKKLELELEDREKTRQAEKEREIRQAELERERETRQAELEIKKLETDKEIRLAEIAGRNRQLDDPPLSPPGSLHSGFANGRHVPVWTDTFLPNQEQFDTYLTRFEEAMAYHDVPRESWCRNLVHTLRGDTYEVYAKLSPSDQDPYIQLKNALLNKFELNARAFQSMFRSARLEEGESIRELVDRLRKYLNKWIELANQDRTYEGLIDLILSEQLQSLMPRTVKTFLAEWGLEGLNEVIVAADRYMLAHKDEFANPPSHPHHHRQEKNKEEAYRHKTPKGPPTPQQRTSNFGQHRPQNPRGEPRPIGPTNPSAHEKHRGGPTPFFPAGAFCALTPTMHSGQDSTNGLSEQEAETPYPRYFTPEYAEHLGRPVTYEDGRHPTPPQTVSQERPRREPNTRQPALLGFAAAIYPGGAPGSGSLNRTHSNSTEKLKINNQLASYLFDTGCESEGIAKRAYIRDSDFTGDTVQIQSIWGHVETLPTALVHIESAQFTGLATLAVREDLPYDVILGKKYFTPCHYGSPPPHASVVARTHPEPSATQPTLNPSHQEFLKAQQEDPTLKRLLNEAKTYQGKPRSAGHYSLKGQLLYRQVPLPDGTIRNQLVVPSPYRKQVIEAAYDSVGRSRRGQNATLSKIKHYYFWPGMHVGVNRHLCKLTSRNYYTPPVPLSRQPEGGTPFQGVPIDLGGPFKRTCNRNNRTGSK